MTETRAVSGRASMEICDNCSGKLKDKSFIELLFMLGFKASPDHPNEYMDGQVHHWTFCRLNFCHLNSPFK